MRGARIAFPRPRFVFFACARGACEWGWHVREPPVQGVTCHSSTPLNRTSPNHRNANIRYSAQRRLGKLARMHQWMVLT
jgi:hypothetical protein